MQGMPTAAARQPAELPDERGLDPGAIYRGPIAWQPPDLVVEPAGA